MLMPEHCKMCERTTASRLEKRGRILKKNAPTGQQVEMFKQVPAPPAHVKERAYPKQVKQEGDLEQYAYFKFKIEETIFAAHDKAEMRKTKVLLFASLVFVNTSKSLFWPDEIIMGETDLDRMQSISMAVGAQRQTKMNPITIVFDGINDNLHSRGLLSRLREPATAEAAVWPAIKDVL